MFSQVVNINECRFDFDYSVEGNLKSFKEEVLDELYTLYKEHGDMPLLLSGGMDSTFILRSLVELGIKPRTMTFSYSENADDYECELVKKLHKKYGTYEPEFFKLDPLSFLNFCVNLVTKRKIAYPMIHGFVVHMFLENSTPGVKYFTGMGSEFKLFDNLIRLMVGPQMVMQNNPGRLFDFATSRTFFSYLNHEKFLNNYKKKVPADYQSPEPFYIRDQIYLDCYPDIELSPKVRNMEAHLPYNNLFNRNMINLMRNDVPTALITKHYHFNVDKYFQEKGITF